MDDSRNKHTSPFDMNGEGVCITEHAGHGSRAVVFYKLFALVLVVCFAAYLVMMIHQAQSKTDNINANQQVSDSDEGGNTSSSSKTSSLPEHQITARPAKPEAPPDPNDLANYVASGQAPRMEEVIDRLHDAGIHSGLGAFNPPGTSPPMIGLAVPDDYVLPEGYVRHSQATDDGQRIEPILMFSPDFDFFDSAGQQIVVPENRVVPPNMAPPGLVIRPIEIPRPLEPGGP